jgi:hypothetical protein
MDEISMVPADQFLQCDVRCRQAKMRADLRFGGLAVNTCGDFLQLPPVSRDESRRSLAVPLDDVGHVVTTRGAQLPGSKPAAQPSSAAARDPDEGSSEDVDDQDGHKRQSNLESRQGSEL